MVLCRFAYLDVCLVSLMFEHTLLHPPHQQPSRVTLKKDVDVIGKYEVSSANKII